MVNRKYIAIDLKSFYASVECVERGLDPLTANLVVADESRTDKTICLAVSPSLKAHGIPGRPRLFEVKQKARGIDFIIAKPRMAKYIEVSAKIYGIYLKYIAPEDIHVYSIDEVFMDVTDYLPLYKKTPHELAQGRCPHCRTRRDFVSQATLEPFPTDRLLEGRARHSRQARQVRTGHDGQDSPSVRR